MSQEKIYLSVEMDELGVMRVRDQQGRIVAGVRGVTLRHARDEAATFTLEAFDHSRGEKRWAPCHVRRGS